LDSINDRRWIGWRGDGNKQLNIAAMNPSANNIIAKNTSNETSSEPPSLAVLRRRRGASMFMSWKGNGNNYLNVAKVQTS
jgi:hypothetical protein